MNKKLIGVTEDGRRVSADFDPCMGLVGIYLDGKLIETVNLWKWGV